MFRIHLSACVKPSPIHFPHRPYFRFPLSRLPSKNSTARALLRPLPSPLRPPPCHFFHIPTALQPPLIFTALLLALWVYKCAMLVLFQNRIIYMPSMPPFARSERIAEYAAACRPVTWRQERIRTKDGETLAVAVGEIAGVSRCEEAEGVGERKRVVIIYFQGNGSSLPPRLPGLSSILKLLHNSPLDTPSPPTSQPIYTILALSYRGYWTSTGRPSEPGLTLDADAILAYATRNYPPSPTTRFVLWGQSLGASVALAAAAAAAATSSLPLTDSKPSTSLSPGPPVHGILLETPFLSIRAMLLALYPQSWLPYRYLTPFLRNHWDSRVALRRLAASRPSDSSIPSWTNLNILILQASRDELVPPIHAVELERSCLALGFAPKSVSDSAIPPPFGLKGFVHRVEVGGAFHTDVLNKAAGKGAVVAFLRGV